MKNSEPKRIRLTVPQVGRAELEALTPVLESGYLVSGEQVRRFEARVSDFLGGVEAAAVSSGTAALHLALIAHGIGPGHSVIVPDFTFVATANAVELAGARTILADVDPATAALDPARLEGLLQPHTRAVMPVHQFGYPADMEAISAFAGEHDLILIEDAACALGARFRGRPCGVMGRSACFSLHPRKIITTGEGGLVVSADPEFMRRIRALRNHGLETGDAGPQVDRPGFNYRMTELQAAIGLVQMDRLGPQIESRKAAVETYTEILGQDPRLQLPAQYPGAEPCFQTFFLALAPAYDRGRVLAELDRRGVEASVGAASIHAFNYYRKTYGRSESEFPGSLALSRRGLALPLWGGIPAGDVRCAARALLEILDAMDR